MSQAFRGGTLKVKLFHEYTIHYYLIQKVTNNAYNTIIVGFSLVVSWNFTQNVA